MDEPTVGLDPQARRMIWGLIESLKRNGITILLTTHYIEEADALCDRVAIMQTGKIIALDTPVRAQGRRGQVLASNAWGGTISRGSSSTRGKRRSMQPRDVCDGHRGPRVTLEDVFINLTGERIEG